MSVEGETELVMPSNPEDLKKVNDALQVISQEMTKVELHRETIQETVTFIHEEYNIPKSIVRRLAKTVHARNVLEVLAQDAAFVKAYDAIASVNNQLSYDS